MDEFQVIFYENKRGQTPVREWVNNVFRLASQGDKQARILQEVIKRKAQLLKVKGTRASDDRVNEWVWEIRCKDSRILFGQYRRCIVWTHYIPKKDYNKLHQRDIKIASARMSEWVSRHRGDCK